MILLSALTPILKPTPVICVPSHSRQCLQRIQGHHSLRFDHLVHSRNHQAMLPSNQHYLNESHYSATPATRSGTFPETAVQNPPLRWNSRDTTSLHHSRTTSSSCSTRIPKTSRISRSHMTGKSQRQRKSQQPQLTDNPDRCMGHAQRIQHPQDQRNPQHHQR